MNTVVTLEVFNKDDDDWITVPGKALFSASNSRFVEAKIDDLGAVSIDFDDGLPVGHLQQHHLVASIEPSPKGKGAVTISGPHGGADPYNIQSDTMNAQCVFQKRKGTDGPVIEVLAAE